MTTRVIDCAGCGAPLGDQLARVAARELVPCLYCGALLRFDASSAPGVVERRVTQDVMARAREAAMRGGRAAAIDVCVREAGVSEAAAAAAVDDMIKNVANRTLFTQPLSPLGWVMWFGAIGLVAAGAAVVVLPSSLWWAGLPLAAFGLLNVAVLARAAATSLRFIVAARGIAVVRHAARVGPTSAKDGTEVYALAVDVTPDAGGAPFHARVVVPVRAQSVEKVQPGRRIGVRFADGGAWIRSDGARNAGS